MNLRRAKQKFNRRVTEWSRAEEECREAYVAWQVACRRRERAAIDKNNAWEELEMARAEMNVHQQLEVKP